ncbi:MAG: hypothetical protein Q9184_007066 [Pyrenodesmia sp. 2 TL-2023]
MQRKDEIMAKKAKLAELRRQREERERKQKELSGRDMDAPTPPKRNIERKDLDSIIDDLVGNRRSSYGVTSSPSARKSRPTSTTDVRQVQPEAGAVSPVEAPQVQTVSIATQTLSTVFASVNYEFIPTSGPRPDVSSYSKGIQTSDFGSPPRRRKSPGRRHDSDSDSSSSFSRSPRNFKRRSRRDREREEELRQNLRREIEEEIKAAQKSVSDVASTEAKYPARSLTEEELTAVTASEDFLDFVERSSKVIERALDQDYNILADYSIDGVAAVDSDEDDVYGRAKGKKGRRIRQIAQFYDERWSKKRMISDIDFSSRVSTTKSFDRLGSANAVRSSQSWYLPRIPKTPPPQRILQVFFKSGIYISILDPSTPFIQHQIFSQPNSRHFTLRCSLVARTADRSCFGILALGLLCPLRRRL